MVEGPKNTWTHHKKYSKYVISNQPNQKFKYCYSYNVINYFILEVVPGSPHLKLC